MARKKTVNPDGLTSGQVYAAVVQYHHPNAVVVAEVPDATGFDAKRRIDALAIGCWPSRGLYVHAIEIKVSRADLKREIFNPDKAEAIAVHCDEFYIAAPKGVVANVDDLPPEWGLLEVRGEKTVKVRPGKRRKKKALNTMSREFFAAVVRAVVEQQSDEKVMERACSKARNEGYQSAWKLHEKSEESLREEVEELRTKLRAYRGMGYYGHVTPEQLGRLVTAADNLVGRMGSMNSLRANAQGIVKSVEVIEEIAKAAGLDLRHDDG